MRRTLEMTVIEGIKTSIPLHLRILADPDFIAGRLSTSFMERYLAEKKPAAHGSRRGRVVVRHARSSVSIRSSTPTSAASRGLEPRALAARCFHGGGAASLQLRVKSGSSGGFLRSGRSRSSPRRAVRRGGDRQRSRRHRPAGGAAGVHVGQDDLPPDAVREVSSATASSGCRRTTRQQVDAGLTSPADYVAVGPVFGTVDQGHRLQRPRPGPGAARRRTGQAGRRDRRDHARPGPGGDRRRSRLGGGHHRSADRRRLRNRGSATTFARSQ